MNPMTATDSPDANTSQLDHKSPPTLWVLIAESDMGDEILSEWDSHDDAVDAKAAAEQEEVARINSLKRHMKGLQPHAAKFRIDKKRS